MGAGALLRLVTQHLGSYAELGVAVAGEYRSAWARRAAWVLLAVVTGITGIAALWATGLIAVWGTPWRLAYAAVSALLLVVLAGVALRVAIGRGSSGPAAGLLKQELQKDRELYDQWTSKL